MGVQFITDTGGARLAVMPEAEYRALAEAYDTLDDIDAIERFRERLAAGDEEMVPSEVVDRLLDGENKVRVWREHRGMSVKALAEASSLSAAYVSQIETGVREGKIDTYKAFAAALNVTIDDLV